MAKKRANGEGYVRQRKDGLWEAGSARDEFGKRIVAYAATQKLAIKKRDQKLKDKDDGLIADVARLTLAAYLRDWMETVIKRKRTPATIDSYTHTIEKHIIPHFGETLKLRALKESHIDQLITKQHEAKLTRTMQYTRDVLRSALNTAKARHYITHNPAENIVIPKTKKRKLTVWTEDETQRFLAALVGHPYELAFLLCLLLGLRRGEVLGLRDSEINLTRGFVMLSGTVQRTQKKLTRQERTKGDDDPVMMPLSPDLCAAIAQHQADRDARKATRLALGRKWSEHGLLFPSLVGTPIEPRNFLRSFADLLGEANLPAIRIHDLRHACAHYLIDQGEQPRVVMEILRHKQISTTMEHYGHVFTSAQQSALAGVEQRLKARGRSSGGSTREVGNQNGVEEGADGV